jgi:hypothetical protein
MADQVATQVIRLTHPSGRGAFLKDLRPGAIGETVTVLITVGWRGGLTNSPYETTVRWEFNSRRHVLAEAIKDSAAIKIAPANAKALDEYFRDKIYSMVNSH